MVALPTAADEKRTTAMPERKEANDIVRWRDVEALREMIERIMHERDRHYTARFTGQEVAVQAALAAQKELYASDSAARDRANVKYEEAQREYNIRSNEFRQALDDQAKLLMPRNEVNTLFKSYEEKLDDMKKEVQDLRIWKSESGGRDFAGMQQTDRGRWTVEIVVAIGAAMLAFLTAVAVGAVELMKKQ